MIVDVDERRPAVSRRQVRAILVLVVATLVVSSVATIMGMTLVGQLVVQHHG